MVSTKLGTGDFGADVARVHEALARHGIEVSAEERKRNFFGPTTREAVGKFQAVHGMDPTCEVCESTATKLLSAAKPTAPERGRVGLDGAPRDKVTSLEPAALVPAAAVAVAGTLGIVGVGDVAKGPLAPTIADRPAAAVSARVAGTIALEHGSPASQVKVRLYQRGFGGTKTLLNEAQTDERGGYAIPYAAQGAANIEVYVIGADGAEVQLSQTKFGAQADEQIDLIAPSSVQPAASEFARLITAVAPHTGNLPQGLKDAVERGDRRDFTYLANATGWDAGALALASEALDSEARTKIPSAGLYALARAGLPTDVRRLAQVSNQTVASALRQAVDGGIVDAAIVDKSVQAFREFAAEYKFTNSIGGAISSPQEFVAKARVLDADRAAFAMVARDEATGDLWGRAKAGGVSDEGIRKLQLQGKLAYLTFNNAELTDYLASKVTSDPLALIELGYYDEARWEGALRELAGTDSGKLGALIPATFAGRTADERMGLYTAELARRVRQMDPHAVTVDRIATGKIDGVTEKDHVGMFLKNATTLGFRLGQTPLGSFVAKNRDGVWNGIAPEKEEDVLNSMRTLSALYATSPTDEALSALLLAGFKSATSIAKYDYRAFSARMKLFLPQGPKEGDIAVTQKIFWKAQQQSATVFNVFDGLKRLNSLAYAPGSTPSDAKRRDEQILKTREKLAGLFPTLETLFGSVDYCECKHCQSVLSPAAYLVDLLHFLDPNEEAWATVKASYQARVGFAYAKRKPFDVLNGRRPDIKNIALTCENTNTALPYIDIVNEILEQVMMADQVPPEIEAYDVGEASSQDLIAEPQNILWSAYVGAPGKKGLRDLVYPLTLPFELPLETARALLKQLDLPLWRLRECLARPSTLWPSTIGRTDGWTDVWFERLGLGAGDVLALTRSDKWYELFGYESQSAALKVTPGAAGAGPAETSLRNGKTLARRLSVTYEELVELVRTRFINPEIESLLVLKRLGVDPDIIDRHLGEGSPLSSEEKSVLDAGLAAQGLTAADLASLRSAAIRKATLVLRSPSVGCDFSQTTLAFDQEPAEAELAIALVLRRMNAFVRLQKKLGWATHELDRALMALMPGATTVTMETWSDAMRTALIYLAHVEELRERFQDRLSREEIVVLWSDIPTVGISCLYERLFMSSGGLGRDAAFKKRLGRALENKAITLIDQADAVRQAFQLGHDEIEPILKAASAMDGILSIENLSTLMRHALLAKGLGLPVADLLALMSLSERKPLSPLSPMPLAALDRDVPWSETLAFVREVELIRAAGVDVAFLDRICRHRGVAEQPGADNDPVLIALSALAPANPANPEQQQTLLVQTLAAQLSAPEAVVDRLLSGLLKDASNKPLKETGFSAATRATSVQKLRKALDLIQSLGITDGELQYLTGLSGAVRPNDLPVEAVATDSMARTLKNGLTGWLSLAAARRQFGRSERLLAVLAASRQTLDATNTIVVREEQLLEAMTALTGLKSAGLASALEAIGIKSAGGSTFEVPALADPESLLKTIESLKCFTRLGLNPKEVVQFARDSIDETVAQRLRSSVKGRYTASAWRRLAKPIFDGLRKKQRDALVAHLTHVMEGDLPKYGDTAEKLFEYLLLDPGMEPVVVASRIQLAIAAVQLFVQRCLMNLEEPGVDPQIIDNQRWEWMRRYRVWEVNRKMFIWPENWLDPEFRDDKTHLFRDLEGKLLQGDVNDDLVRTSLHSYLKGLEEIARLEMLTMYFEPGVSADGSIVHVVGRTQSAPHQYFYRKCGHGMWTPWEPIDVGIEGEHLVLTAWRGRMHLFWVSFLEQAVASTSIPDVFTPGTDSVNKSDLEGTTQVKLQLHWVEQTQGKWINRSSTPGFLKTAFSRFKATTDADKRKFFARAVVIEHEAGVADDDLEIHITQGSTAHKFVFFSKLAPPRSMEDGNAPAAPPFEFPVPAGNDRATKWRGEGALRVKFVSAVTQNSETGTQERNGGYHKVLGGTDEFMLLFPSNETLPVPARTPPAGVGRPAAYVFGPQNAKHVAYRSGDGSIHDLFWTKNGWFYQSPSADAERSSAADAEPASSDPHGYAVDDRGVVCIAYAGSSKIHELVWSQLDSALDDPEQLGTGWRIETLYEGASAADQPQGRPFGGLFLPKRGVVFRVKDGRLRAAVEVLGNASWEILDLNAALPKAASDPTGLLMTKTDLGVLSVVSRHIFYLGVDGNVHELRSDAAGRNWTYTNLSQSIAGVIKPAPESTPAAYAFLAQKTLHVVYRGTDDRVHEFWGNPGSWNYNPIGAGFAKAKGDPAGYVTESFFTQHVVYRGEGDEVVELWWSDRWRENVLTRSAPGAPKATSDVTGYSFESLRTQHVVYFAEDGSPRELWWGVGGWQKGSHELTNPFPDDLGPLASPFFYERRNKDHTFFVEPYVVETAVHEWTEWIVTTKEYVDIQLAKDMLVPLHPEAIAVEPNNVGIIKKNPNRFKKKVFDERTIVRTGKGVIQPYIDVKALMSDSPPGHIKKSLVVVDVGLGHSSNSRVGGIGRELGGF